MNNSVLILVLMEYGLGQYEMTAEAVIRLRSLNPCFNGIWSRTSVLANLRLMLVLVLILVLMEYGLGLWKELIGALN